MDLVTPNEPATALELEALDSIIAADPHDEHFASGDATRHSRRHLLLPALHALSHRVGWISPQAIDELARRIGIAPAEIHGVASFYPLFSLEPTPTRQVHACVDLACRMKGMTEDALPAVAAGVACLGMCDQAPAAAVAVSGEESARYLLGGVTPETLGALALKELRHARHPDDRDHRLHEGRVAAPQSGDPSLVLLRRVGVVDPESLADYRAHGGYDALRRALAMGPAAVLREVADANVIGRGGAGFPTGTKWEAVAKQPVRPHYVICNADESEPGTFKDRVILQGDPFAVIEAMTIAAFATASERGWIYLRAEYPVACKRMANAIDQARRAGLLGDDVMGAGFAFDIEMARGAGAYVCGEETAIFNSIEGYRGEPRSKPPFPVEVGLFGKPTLVNNVETLINVLPAISMGASVYGRRGTPTSAGHKLFCVSGAVTRPGTYEVEFGATVADLIALAGGPSEGSRLQAVLLGGAAGGFIGPRELGLRLTFEDARAAGTTIGSGVVMVIDDRVDIADLIERVAAFFRHESCGQCVPCRVGTVRQEELIQRLRATEPGSERRTEELALLKELAQVMRDASICGLGQTAPNAIESAVTRLGVLS